MCEMKLGEVVGIWKVWPNHGGMWGVMEFGLVWKESYGKGSRSIEKL